MTTPTLSPSAISSLTMSKEQSLFWLTVGSNTLTIYVVNTVLWLVRDSVMINLSHWDAGHEIICTDSRDPWWEMNCKMLAKYSQRNNYYEFQGLALLFYPGDLNLCNSLWVKGWEMRNLLCNFQDGLCSQTSRTLYDPGILWRGQERKNLSLIGFLKRLVYTYQYQ